ncbi:MAG: S9 family peptidase, partial [Halobacteria archaeon]
MYDVERYLRIRSAYAPSFLPDGSLIYLNDTTGATQAWRIEEPLSWQSQVSFGDEPISFAAASPERDELIYGRDEGGNERTQLFRVDSSGGNEVELTDVQDAKHRWGGWSHDGERFAFASNRRDQRVFDIYTQGRAEDDATLVCETDGWYSVVGWLPDDSALIVREARSNFDHDLYIVDADGGELELVTDADRETRYRSVSASPDGDALYMSTDEGTDTLYLGHLDIETGEMETVVDGDDRNVSGVSVDDETGRLVYGRNVEGFTELHAAEIDDGNLHELPTPDLPDGAIGGTSFSPDGERFAVTVTRRTRNANVYVVDFETGEATRWTDATTAGISPDTFVAPDVVRYGSFDGLSVPALFTTPDGANHEPPYPVIVDIHGGPES